jgi:hypothetical protein
MAKKKKSAENMENVKFEVAQEMGLVNKANKKKIKSLENTSSILISQREKIRLHKIKGGEFEWQTTATDC